MRDRESSVSLINNMTLKLTADYERAIQRLQKQSLQASNVSGNAKLLVDMNLNLKKRVLDLEN